MRDALPKFMVLPSAGSATQSGLRGRDFYKIAGRSCFPWKIVCFALSRREIPSKKLYEDEQVVAFYDINPQAKVHFLVVPKKHISSAAALTEKDGALLGHIFAVIAKLAKEQGLENGYRIISNVGEDAGQTVKHLHFHVLGGEKLPV